MAGTVDTVTFTQELIKLLPVFAGGLLTAIGGAATQFLVHQLGISRERRALFREKGERMLLLLGAHGDWLGKRVTVFVFSDEKHDEVSPLDEANAIQSLYFPELGTPFLRVLQTMPPIIKWIHDQRMARTKDSAAWLKSYNSDEWDQQYKIYSDAMIDLRLKAGIAVRKQV